MIEKGNWLVVESKEGKFSLEKMEDFSYPDKLYGNMEAVSARYVKSFNNSKSSMGILLTGLKGGGKTLTAKLTCREANLPVLIISQAFSGEAFQAYLANLNQEVVVFIDEFEKVFEDAVKQQQLLPLLDGVFETKILFIFTSNTMDVNKFLKNRPGRIRYLKHYGGLEKDELEEIIEDLLLDKEKKQGLLEMTYLLSSVSVDVLMYLINEMNEYDEKASESIKFLNIQVEHAEFDVLMYIKGAKHVTKIHYNPITSKYLHFSYKDQDSRGHDRWNYYDARTDNLSLQVVDGEFIYEDKRNGDEIRLTPAKKFRFSL